MKRIIPMVAALAMTAAVCVLAILPQVSSSHINDARVNEPGLVMMSGYTIHLDPATGKPVSSEAGIGLSVNADFVNALSTSDEGLIERASDVDGGGTYVDLEGRFQHANFATVDGNKELAVSCAAHAEIHTDECRKGGSR